MPDSEHVFLRGWRFARELYRGVSESVNLMDPRFFAMGVREAAEFRFRTHALSQAQNGLSTNLQNPQMV